MKLWKIFRFLGAVLRFHCRGEAWESVIRKLFVDSQGWTSGFRFCMERAWKLSLQLNNKKEAEQTGKYGARELMYLSITCLTHGGLRFMKPSYSAPASPTWNLPGLPPTESWFSHSVFVRLGGGMKSRCSPPSPTPQSELVHIPAGGISLALASYSSRTDVSAHLTHTCAQAQA